MAIVHPFAWAREIFLPEPESERAFCSWRIFGSSLAASVTVGSILCNQQSSFAQAIAPDNTLGPESSVVVPNVEIRGVDSDRIDGGAQRGANLFHSFQEFNIETGRGAYFSNPAGVDNILTRVTGENLSNIDGVLGVLGDASLFLINPNGLIFGPGARLDLNGSFVGSTAESALFEEYEFSAVNPSAPPMLTLNVPMGLQVGESPGEIIVRSQLAEMTGGEFAELADASGLRVPPGETLALIGGDVRFEAGRIRAPGADVRLGGLAAAGVVSLDADANASFPEGVARADFSAIDGAEINVEGDGGGSIALSAGNLSLQGESLIRAGIAAGSTSGSAAGNISIDATGAAVLGGSEITNNISGIGNGGDIQISSNTLEPIDGTEISTNIGSAGVGEAGAVRVQVTESIILQGASSSGQPSFIGSLALPGAEGSLGETVIEANSLALFDGASIGSITAGAVNSGTVQVRATDFISLQGESNFGIIGGIISLVGPGAEGDSGGISIATGSLSLTDAAMVNASTVGSGNAGAIQIQATDSVTLDGEVLGPTTGSPSGIISSVLSGAVGNSQGIILETGNLSLLNGAIIATSTVGSGDAGAIQIRATDAITLQGESSLGFSSISSTVEPGAEGNSQGILIETGNLSLIDGAFINTATEGIGDAGAIQIQATDSVTLDGEVSGPATDSPSSIISAVSSEAVGNSQGILIETSSISLLDGAIIVASTSGSGDAGAIQIRATDAITLQGESSLGFSSISSTVEPGAEGNSQGILIETGNLSLIDGAFIDTTTQGTGDAGAIQIQATAPIVLQGNSDSGGSSTIISSVFPGAVGDSGGIAIATANLSLEDGATLFTSTFGDGDAGAIQIQATDAITLQGESIFTPSGIFSMVGIEGEGASQGIGITTSSLSLLDGSGISATTLGDGDAGAIQIQATDSIVLQGELSNITSDVFLGAEGNSQGIAIETSSLLLLGSGTGISASTFGDGDAGAIQIQATESVALQGELGPGGSSGIASLVGPEATGNSQGITIATPLLTLSGQAIVSADTLSLGDAGEIVISPPADSPNLNIDFGTSSFISTQTASSGAGGEIDISAPQILTIDGQGNITASTTAGSTGTSGNIFLNAETIAIGDTAIAVNSQGSAPGGNLTITANDLNLERSEITATTANTDGGNITLDLAGILSLRDESLISTTAGTAAAGGDGGIVEIDSLFIVAFPSAGAGNDITANAFEGEGGSINIESEGLFGIEFQDDLATPGESASNDITVTSTFGDPGNLTVTSPEVDPTSALVDLPESGVEVAVQDGCQVGAEGSLAFYQIGRGGLPLNGSAAAEASAVLGSWTPTEEEAARLPFTNSDLSNSASAPLQVMPAGDLHNLQRQRASVRFVPACGPDKALTSTQTRLEK